MRRILLVTALACGLVPVVASAADAKGWEEHSTVTIRGPGLDSPIRLRGEAAATFVFRSGAGQSKWDVPNIGGTLSPHADLGPAYTAMVGVRCGGGVLGVYHQILYPRAPQGLQVFTPKDAKVCFPGELSSGYWPAAKELQALLVSRGLPPGSATKGSTSTNSTPAAAVVTDRGGGSPGTLLAVVGWLLVIVLLGAGGMMLRRRRGVGGAGSP